MSDQWPRVCTDFPGTGGEIKQRPEDFVVEEIPAYDPCGEGEHVYLKIRKTDVTTFDAARVIGEAFGVGERDVGYAGMKDRRGVTTQWISVPFRGDPSSVLTQLADLEWPAACQDEAADRPPVRMGMEVVEWSRHRNKLRRGHLIGNRFEVWIRGIRDDVERAALESVKERLEAHGFLNIYGPQRFGYGGSTLRTGRFLLSGGRRVKGRKARLAVNAVQSALFNDYVAKRVATLGVHVVQAGDVLRLGTGPTFVCDDPIVDQTREDAREVVVTGPLFGPKMMKATGQPGEIEESLLEAGGAQLVAARFRGAGGARRAVLCYPRELSLELDEGARAVCVRMVLDAGSYATVALNEVTGEHAEPVL